MQDNFLSGKSNFTIVCLQFIFIPEQAPKYIIYLGFFLLFYTIKLFLMVYIIYGQRANVKLNIYFSLFLHIYQYL